MADKSIGHAYVQIIPKAEGISGKIEGLIAPGAKSAGTKGGKQAGAGLAGGIKKALAGLAIGATIGAGVKAALDEGGKLQQSYGGLETIYGDAAKAAKEYAAEAAQAGISANSYAEQAVSFGASLKQAFEGDTAAAVEAANTAILDMTDNAAKMGTPIENIQNAYQGFAKQNYTMLDNLKLGYGGTKTEMERLLADAQAITGVEYNIDNLGDVYEAIHVIQGELGLTGVAAQEASETFSGSFSAMQAAGANLLGNLALGENIQESMSTFVSSAATFLFGNFLPMVGTVFASIPSALGTAFQTAFPIIVEKGKQLITNLVTGVTTGAPVLLEKVKGIATNLIAAAPAFIESAKQIVMNIANTIVQNIPVLIEKAKGLINGIKQGIITYAPMVFESAKTVIGNFINGVIQALPGIISKGTELISGLISGIGAALPGLAAKAAEIITTVASFISQNLPVIAAKGDELIKVLVANLIAAIPTLLSAIAKLIPKVISAVSKLIPAVVKALAKLVPAALQAAKNLLMGLVDGIRNGWSAISPAVTGLINKITKPLKTLIAKVRGIMNDVKTAMSNVWDSIKTKAGTAFEAVKKKITEPIEKAKTTVKNVLDKIKGFFPVSIGNIFSNLKLPHFNVSGGTAPWGIGGKGTKPSFSVDWYAKGGVFDSPSVIGVGEAGTEAVIPLQGSSMKPFAEAIAESMESASATNTFYVTLNANTDESPEQFADRFVKRLQMEVRMA